jgi:DNA-binding NtrC family response regulator
MTSTASNILVIDDDLETCNFLREIFEEQGWRVTAAPNASTALAMVEAEKFDLIVSDINLNDPITGLALLKQFRDKAPLQQVILISGFGTLETAIEAVQEGAFDFISKPFDVQEIIATARRALALTAEEHPEEIVEDKEILDRYASSGLVGHSRQMIDLYKEIARVAPHRSTVLIIGESGVGKELVARAIHTNSTRRNGPFVGVNCGALTESLLEAELFGHTKGSFTGAVADKRGLFEEAEHGTIFLDEISETSPALQVKLLRVLQENEIRRVGSSKALAVDARVIAATNRDLESEVKHGRFREDLYYRLSVITLQVPALRDRRDDISLLAAHFLRLNSRETGKRVSLSPEALEMLLQHDWSGNVRELENSIEYAVLHTPGRSITPDDLPLRIRVAKDPEQPLPDTLFSDLPPLEEVERRYLIHVLEAVGGNRTRAAEVMQIDRRTLYRMAERFGIKLDGD